jgi:hypothetical protein
MSIMLGNVTIGIGLFLISFSSAWAQSETATPINRDQLLKELRKCTSPRSRECDEMAVYRAAELYKQGDQSILQNLMDTAPHSDGALSEALGEVFSDLLCDKPVTFLKAVARRQQSVQSNLLFLAAAGDGSGMGCTSIESLRNKLKAISRRRNDPIANLAKRCLVQVNKYNNDR